MQSFLMLKLAGMMQAWGSHTYEVYRPSLNFPSRSGLLGLLGACLGLRRDDEAGQLALAQSIRFSVRADERTFSPVKLADFHTVLDARKVGGKISHYPVVSRREYLCDASFTVAVKAAAAAPIPLAALIQAVQQPVFTPYLGRRSCPLQRPLFEAVVEAADSLAALSLVEPLGGVIYSEEGEAELPQLRLRDEPIIVRPRQFASRRAYIHSSSRGESHVPEQD
ncbi:type I-E CRISPR-associated protein Cas5/CasD [Nitrosococcus watsonii]|uniref:CRISPR-associated protein Cas5 family n=1 Tax=Nitrosococcus watsoni (strain C-113) TaxID=105559 RepID=D8K5Y8_NITWC|nr:type I-E CRISPR-associated protein Cas5/CasD [Nitrosococcus watsonii]ADJ28315.1 CRISPR-associated protein Cas5 family [Nitrosococcus watsonii C-113]